MGLLKHAILPFFLALHGYALYRWVRYEGTIDRTLDAVVPWTLLLDTSSSWMGTGAAAHAVLLVNGAAGVLREGAHYRGMAILLEIVYFGWELYDAWIKNSPTEVLVGIVAVAIVGASVHSMEPGIFAKDKNKKSKAS
jgi:hypothetical protein